MRIVGESQRVASVGVKERMGTEERVGSCQICAQSNHNFASFSRDAALLCLCEKLRFDLAFFYRQFESEMCLANIKLKRLLELPRNGNKRVLEQLLSSNVQLFVF